MPMSATWSPRARRISKLSSSALGTQLLQPDRLGADGIDVVEIRERRPSPQRIGFRERGGSKRRRVGAPGEEHELLEPQRVELVAFHAKSVAGGLGDEPAARRRPAAGSVPIAFVTVSGAHEMRSPRSEAALPTTDSRSAGPSRGSGWDGRGTAPATCGDVARSPAEGVLPPHVLRAGRELGTPPRLRYAAA